MTDIPKDAADRTVAAVLGEIVWLMSPSSEHKATTIGDLEWMVMPAILLRQFRLFYKRAGRSPPCSTPGCRPRLPFAWDAIAQCGEALPEPTPPSGG